MAASSEERTPRREARTVYSAKLRANHAILLPALLAAKTVFQPIASPLPPIANLPEAESRNLYDLL